MGIRHLGGEELAVSHANEANMLEPQMDTKIDHKLRELTMGISEARRRGACRAPRERGQSVGGAGQDQN